MKDTKDMSREVCVCCGCYFLSECIIGFCSELLMFIIKYLPQNMVSMFSLFGNLLDLISGLIFAVFVFLLLRYLFTAKSLSWIQKIINNFPKISIYLYYIGYVGYILLLLNALLLAPIYLSDLSEINQVIIAWIIIIMNIGGILLALILATRCLLQKYKH